MVDKKVKMLRLASSSILFLAILVHGATRAKRGNDPSDDGHDYGGTREERMDQERHANAILRSVAAAATLMVPLVIILVCCARRRSQEQQKRLLQLSANFPSPFAASS